MEDGAANLPAPQETADKGDLARPIINPDSSSYLNRSFTSTSTTSSSSSSPPQFLRQIQAAFKRHRPLGVMPSNNIRPRRMVSQRETSKGSALNVGSTFDLKKNQDENLSSHKLRDCISQSKILVSSYGEAQDDASITLPSEWASTLDTHDESFKPFDPQGDRLRPFTNSRNNDTVASSVAECENVLPVEGQKKVHFAPESNARSQEMEWDALNQVEGPTAPTDLKHRNVQSAELDNSLRSDGGLLAKRIVGASDQLHQIRNFLQNDLSNPMTQSSVIGSSCTTTTLINSTSAPMLNSTTNCSMSHSQSFHLEVDQSKLISEFKVQGQLVQGSCPSSKYISQLLPDHVTTAAQPPGSNAENQVEIKKSLLCKEQKNIAPKESDVSKHPSPLDGNAGTENITDIQSQDPLSKVKAPALAAKPETSKSERQEKVASKAAPASRKKHSDPDMFFKVNEKLYQRLGKIGSGGSSEVHKVISSDCTIYALKKIKLRGRDYATAYGFCQEIEYLNKLKGKNNIIQLVDYEVTDKALLREVMNGSMSNKDGRVKEDGYIYMVLEYGEIDLAHMLSQKWKELDSSKSTIDENWLRFYWQQILLAVNTIHEERIVHSDLKPANFLLVRGSLKLIDFGIAKAIMSDTTNIQRDSQVGTLSYMSPEAFMCNETDADGNVIKCGRPSDIWSLGCILYQMVYGRTPFSDYKTFWQKFKVITDPNHEIIYEPVSNPWLIDLMKKCLAWNRNERWRIPELLQHPFLVPPLPPQLPTSKEENYELLQLIVGSCENDEKALTLCSQLQRCLKDPRSLLPPPGSLKLDKQQKLLCHMSNLCLQLQQQLANLEREMNH